VKNGPLRTSLPGKRISDLGGGGDKIGKLSGESLRRWADGMKERPRGWRSHGPHAGGAYARSSLKTTGRPQITR